MTDQHRIGDGGAQPGSTPWPDRHRFEGVTRLFGTVAERVRAACGAGGAGVQNTGGRGQDASSMSRRRSPGRQPAAFDRFIVSKRRQECAGIPYLALSVAQVAAYYGSHQMTLASGFFYKSADDIYYITNRHVIIDEVKKHYPDSIKLKLHTDPSNIASSRVVSLDLYDSSWYPVWKEHPDYGRSLDVVAIPASPERLGNCKIFALSRERQVPDEYEVRSPPRTP